MFVPAFFSVVHSFFGSSYRQFVCISLYIQVYVYKFRQQVHTGFDPAPSVRRIFPPLDVPQGATCMIRCRRAFMPPGNNPDLVPYSLSFVRLTYVSNYFYSSPLCCACKQVVMIHCPIFFTRSKPLLTSKGGSATPTALARILYHRAVRSAVPLAREGQGWHFYRFVDDSIPSTRGCLFSRSI